MRTWIIYLATFCFLIAEVVGVIQGASFFKIMLSGVGLFAIILFAGNALCSVYENADTQSPDVISGFQEVPLPDMEQSVQAQPAQPLPVQPQDVINTIESKPQAAAEVIKDVMQQG